MLRQIVAGGLALSMLALPAEALPVAGPSMVRAAAPDIVETAAVARRGYVARGPRGGVVAGRSVTRVAPAYRGGAVVRPGYPARGVVVAPGGWARPGSYWWRPGAAVAAGAALGFVTAAAATSYAGRPPQPGQCWYYTNTQRTQGFWDACP